MNLLTSMLLYLVVGCGEWYLALRRTLACARGEKAILVSIVFVENLLGLWVLSNFIRTNNWLLAFSYAAGASAGALIIAVKSEKVAKTAQSHRDTGLSPKARVAGNNVIPTVVRRMSRRPRLSSDAIRSRPNRVMNSRRPVSARPPPSRPSTPKPSGGAAPQRARLCLWCLRRDRRHTVCWGPLQSVK